MIPRAGECLSSRTPLRRLLIRLAPAKPPRWLTARMTWQCYGFLDWLTVRMQDLAMALEDTENEKARTP